MEKLEIEIKHCIYYNTCKYCKQVLPLVEVENLVFINKYFALLFFTSCKHHFNMSKCLDFGLHIRECLLKYHCDFRWLEAMEKAVHPITQVTSNSHKSNGLWCSTICVLLRL